MNQISTATAKKLDLMWNSRRLHDKIVKFIFDQNHSQNVVAKSMAAKYRIPLGCAVQLVEHTVESEYYRREELKSLKRLMSMRYKRVSKSAS